MLSTKPTSDASLSKAVNPPCEKACVRSAKSYLTLLDATTGKGFLPLRIHRVSRAFASLVSNCALRSLILFAKIDFFTRVPPWICDCDLWLSRKTAKTRGNLGCFQTSPKIMLKPSLGLGLESLEVCCSEMFSASLFGI